MKYSVPVVPAQKAGMWITVKELRYGSIVVPSGFKTDGASIPWICQWLVKKGGSAFPAAVVHDYLYRMALVTREQADDIFLNIMVANNVPEWKRKLMYKAVRIFGGKHYGSQRKGSR